MPDYVPQALTWLGVTAGIILSVGGGYLFGGDLSQPLGGFYLFAAMMGPVLAGISIFVAYHLKRAN